MPAVKQCIQTVTTTSYPIKQPKKAQAEEALDIIDIRSNKVDFNLKDEIASHFNPPDGGPRRLPTLLLYDEKGLQLFEDITYLDEYYLTGYEIELLEKYSVEIAAKVPDGAMLIELGSGNLRKVCLLLQAFEDAHKSIDYYALDLSKKELERTLSHVPDFKYVSCHGLLGTYDDGVTWLKQPVNMDRPKCILHLGSSIGNFHRDEAAEFLQSYADVLKPDDSMIVGLDSHAYNDSKGVTHGFVLNGLENANHIYGQNIFHVPNWRVVGEYVYDEEGGRHQAFVSPLEEVTVLGSVVKPHERIQIEQSLKYSKVGAANLWRHAGLHVIGTWSRSDEYGLHMLQRANLPFSKAPSLYATSPLPSLSDWHSLWSAWDIVTKGMLPKQELTEKPIKLRNACIFYLGHIPTFLDIQLTKTTGLAPTHPTSYHIIFERGVDPDVDNPEKCHDHSEIPDEWPPVEEITAYQGRVRVRLAELYEKGEENIPRNVARAIWVGFEHEVMHIETLLYMMLQSDKTLPPPHMGMPDFERMAKKAFQARVANKWFDIPEQVISVGMNDPEEDAHHNGHFGWDNEKPERKVKVNGFQAQGRPITNEEYARYMYTGNVSKIPTSWSSTPRNDTSPTPTGTNGSNGGSNGHSKHIPTDLPESFLQDKSVRTMYGNVPLEYALDWPVMASYDELAGCASWMGGRIPTCEEARSIYAFVEAQKEVDTGSMLVKKVPAVNGHLVNDGVEETPPQLTSCAVENSSLFIDLAGTNVGFKHWHPVPVTSKGGSLAGQSSMGGVWEWTSSPLRRHEGFQPMELYPAYTADFFDDKHNIVLGGSWATHPRIAGRKSFVNWYQRNYLYAWVGARLVRDIE
ncbi:Ergothioneine biosynthesis protein 1 [Conoideocrella luteorostrata]|uniref:Ergothioneine biosynthesis protein 1 n=1 Tax=Conoideocrella luteorostrata TaxID=1105319 RepID=A0AAJ0D035_9HYPO|nr:Ergothioneine biosynthesis protein 1 [Conoideocrella luteorostrata]